MTQTPSPLDEVDLYLVDDYESLGAALRWMEQRRPGLLGVDTETTGLEWWWKHSAMRTLQIGDERTGWTIPADFAGAFKVPLREYARHRTVAMHHASFDLHFLREAGFDLDGVHGNIHDTQVMARLADPLKSGALKSVSTRLVDPMASAGDAMLRKDFRKYGWDWDTVPVTWPTYWQYAALDPVLTVLIANQLYPKVGHTEVYEIERVTAVTLATEMERLGVYTNMEYVTERHSVLGPYLEQLQQWIYQHTGRKVDNPNSDAQVRRFLLEEGCRFTRITPKAQKLLGTDRLDDAVASLQDPGKREMILNAAARKGQSPGDVPCEERGFPIKYLSLDSESLAAIDHPVAEAVKIHRDQSRIRNTYLKAYLDMTDPHGYLHPSIWTMEAKTGRMSISRPSMQNIPRDQHPRNAVMASPDNVLVLSDYDQIEMRLMAHYADDQAMIDYIAEGDRRSAAGEDGYDVHSQNTRLVYGIPMDQPVPKPKRDRTKNTGFATIYGAGDERLAMTSGTTVEEMKSFKRQFLGTFPGIEMYMRRMENEAWRTWRAHGASFVENEMGRRWYIPHPNASYKLTNYTIQGEAAIVLKKGLIRLHEQGLSPYMRLPVHDEIILDVPEPEAEEVRRIVPQLLRDDSYRVPLTADGETYPVWGMKYLKGA